MPETLNSVELAQHRVSDRLLHTNHGRNQAYLRRQLDRLQQAGINAVIFQVRPSADAFYKSAIEPWSRFLTGTAGKAPVPEWDPLQFMTDECHRRGMELHAWINPYRITTSAREQLPAGHIARRHPELTVTYAGKLYFNPGLPENRRHILRVIGDITAATTSTAFISTTISTPIRSKAHASTMRRHTPAMAADSASPTGAGPMSTR